jgi:hypothetical protein
MTNVEHARFEQPPYPRTQSVSWRRSNDTSRPVDTELQTKAKELVQQHLRENEVILDVGQLSGNSHMPADVNGRLVDPVAEKVTIWSCLFTIVLQEHEKRDA